MRKALLVLALVLSLTLAFVIPVFAFTETETDDDYTFIVTYDEFNSKAIDDLENYNITIYENCTWATLTNQLVRNSTSGLVCKIMASITENYTIYWIADPELSDTDYRVEILDYDTNVLYAENTTSFAVDVKINLDGTNATFYYGGSLVYTEESDVTIDDYIAIWNNQAETTDMLKSGYLKVFISGDTPLGVQVNQLIVSLFPTLIVLALIAMIIKKFSDM